MNRTTLMGLSLVLAAPAVADPPPDYYDSVDATSPEALRTSLHAIIQDHTRFPYTSDAPDTWDVLEEADRDPDNPQRIITLYRNASFARRGGGNENYNREHTWPRSFGFPDNGSGLNYPFTDMHHLFLAEADFNSARSNKPYEDCDETCTEFPTEFNDGRGGQGGAYPGDSNWTDGEFTFGRWEVWNGRKGDVARAMFYMAIRYEGGTHGITGASEPDLELTNDKDQIESARTGRNEATAWMGLLDTLLLWNVQDPVDETERRHHEAVAAAQGNRNPFIDNPAWADCLWLDLCGPRINAGMNDAWFNPATPGQGFFITALPALELLFLAHFTFDSQPPSQEATAIVGGPGQRWITALGPVQGNTATLQAELTQGGLFDAPQPKPMQSPGYGQYVVHFDDCNNATVRYEFPGLDLQGEMPITRVVADNVDLCETLSQAAPPARQ